VNATDLLLLGRRLMQIAESALPQGNQPTSLRLVLIDIAYHPGSSITQITDRTGFPQSLVSMSVAKLREIGVVESEPDPADRRRTLVRPTARLAQMAEEGPGAASVHGVVADALADEDQEQLTNVLAALDMLARLLLPDVPARQPSEEPT
jgi:DNA-binding MarR family transcriptional regulator